MAKFGESELRKQIKSGEYENAYLFYGEESYLKEFYVTQIKEKAVDKTFESFNLHMFDGKDISLDDALKDAQMLPMMSEYNLVIVRDYPVEKNQADTKLLEEYLSDCSDTTIFILWYDALEPDVKSAKFKKIIKAFDTAGAAVNLEKRSENDVAKLLVSGAKKRGSSFDINNAKYLISVSGNDMKILLNELDKLANFAKDGEITKDIIDNMAVKCLQARIYDLSKFVVAGNSDKAYGVLNTLFEMKEEPVIILSAISGVYVDMYRVKCAKTAGYTYDDVAKYYNYRGREFALKNASRDCASLSEKQLRDSLDAITQTDIRIKSTAVDKKLLIEELIAKLLITARSM
ncbi:MAG: DNA polymerase III subunit delta [Eubacteriales bacterium]|nr:DNA polymerase III subunit delta [Eubacteriales bacterium]